MDNNNWTGERLETHIFSENMAEHLHRYAIAAEFAKNKVVLDIASGEGYGSNLMAKVATRVYGVDIDQNAIENAQAKYKSANLSFLIGSADKIPIPDQSVDIVVSFETIEHHDKHDEMLTEIKRVLKEDGILIMSSPDKKYYTDETGDVNSFHVKELYQHEFKDLIKKYFSNCRYFNQRFISGSFIEAEEGDFRMKYYSGNYMNLNEMEFTPVYNLVIATNKELNSTGSSFFNSPEMKEYVRKETFSNLQNTLTWKTGRFFLYPFSLIKRIFKS